MEYEPDTDLRDTEQVPLLHEGGIEAFIHREVLPYAPDAWYDTPSVKVGYEISFTRHFYKPQPLRPWRRYGPTFWHWNRKQRDYWRKLWGAGQYECHPVLPRRQHRASCQAAGRVRLWVRY